MSGERFSGEAPIYISKKLRIAAAIVLLVAAAGVWYWTGHEARIHHDETIAALGGVVYRLQCSACGLKFEMPAAKYAAESGPEGVRCTQCGAEKAFRVGDAGDDPGQFHEEMQKYTQIDDIKAAREAAQQEVAIVTAQLASPEVAADPARQTELKRQEVQLRAKIIALDMRWDELLN